MQRSILPVTSPFPAVNIHSNGIIPGAQGENRTFHAIFNTVSREVPHIPQIIHNTISWFRRAHSYYRWYKLYTLQRDARNHGGGAEAVVYGPAITFLADVSQSVNFALNFAVVTKCTLDILSKYRELNSALSEWRNTLCHKTIDRRAYPLDHQVHNFSRSIILWDQETGTRFLQIIKIIRCTLVVLWKAFELSMILEDTRLYFARDDQTRFVACTDLVVNWRSYADRFGNEMRRVSESLGREIQENEPLAQKLLTELGENNSHSLVNNVISSLRGAENIIRAVLPQNDQIGGMSLLPFDRRGNFELSRYSIPQIPRGHLRYSSASIIPLESLKP